jgi:hypothetical protein
VSEVHHLLRDGFILIGTKLDVGWAYPCDGMPTPYGCLELILRKRRLAYTGDVVLPGSKRPWLVTYGIDAEGHDDRFTVLVYCPDCADVVRAQEPQFSTASASDEATPT